MFEKYAYKHIAQKRAPGRRPSSRHVFMSAAGGSRHPLYGCAPFRQDHDLDVNVPAGSFRVSGDLVYYEIMNGQRGAPGSHKGKSSTNGARAMSPTARPSPLKSCAPGCLAICAK